MSLEEGMCPAFFQSRVFAASQGVELADNDRVVAGTMSLSGANHFEEGSC